MSKSPKILRTSYVYRPLSRYFHWVCSRESTLTVAQLDSLISWDALPKDLTLLGTYICMQRVLNARKKIWKVLLLTRCRFYGRARRFSIPDFHCGCTHGCNQHLQSFRPPSRYLFWISSDKNRTLITKSKTGKCSQYPVRDPDWHLVRREKGEAWCQHVHHWRVVDECNMVVEQIWIVLFQFFFPQIWSYKRPRDFIAITDLTHKQWLAYTGWPDTLSPIFCCNQFGEFPRLVGRYCT